VDRAKASVKRSQAVALSIGSVDPTQAAGVTVDLAVYRAAGVAGTCAIAALTAQNARRVTGMHPIPAAFLRRQLESIWQQVLPHAICIGLLPDARLIRSVDAFLRSHAPRYGVVIDPVAASSSGHTFCGPREIAALRTLCARATIVTPNASEAALLTGRPVRSIAEALAAAQTIARAGCAVLVTGGHLPGSRCTDVLVDRYGVVRRFSGARIASTLRGSGGILAAGITAWLARGASLEEAVLRARAIVRRAFRAARRVGRGAPQLVI